MPNTTHRTWLGYREAAAYAGITERALRRAVQLGKVEVVRLGRRTLFSPEAIDAWISASTQKASA